MHVVINALLLDLSPTYRGAGISHYQQRLLEALSAVSDGDVRITAFVHDRRWQAPANLGLYRPGWSTAHPVGRILWEQTVQPWAVRRLRAEVYHSLAFVTPVWGTDIPQVVTVHDLSFVRFPDTLPPWKARYLRWFTRLSLRRASRVIAVSESTRQDILRWLALPPDRVVTVPNGVDPHFRPLPRADVEAWRRRQGLPERFVLYVGTLQPRKNLETLLRAYARWREQAPASWRGVPLVLAGATGWYADTLFRLVDALDLRPWVRFPGYIPAADLVYWYNAATVFVYPSRFEGFGLPVLEAMACGTPVIAAKATSLPEIVGTAGILVPPDDVEGWRQALDKALRDEDMRRILAQAAQERARRFSWERTARETLAVYRGARDAVHG